MAQQGHKVAPMHDFRDLAGAAPLAYAGGMYDSEGVMGEGSASIVRRGNNGPGTRTTGGGRSASGFNLRGVAEVLTEFGMDPTRELCKVLQGSRPVTDRSGRAILDHDGQPIVEPLIDIATRTKVLLGLQQFVSPKLKAVEVTHKGAELTDDQVDARLAALLAKAAVNG